MWIPTWQPVPFREANPNIRKTVWLLRCLPTNYKEGSSPELKCSVWGLLTSSTGKVRVNNSLNLAAVCRGQMWWMSLSDAHRNLAEECICIGSTHLKAAECSVGASPGISRLQGRIQAGNYSAACSAGTSKHFFRLVLNKKKNASSVIVQVTVLDVINRCLYKYRNTYVYTLCTFYIYAYVCICMCLVKLQRILFWELLKNT